MLAPVGEVKPGQVTRTDHKGTHIRTSGPTTTNNVVEDNIQNMLMKKPKPPQVDPTKDKRKKKKANDCDGCAGPVKIN